MEIQEIKTQLRMLAVLHYYGLKPVKNAKLKYPFHDGKTPSLQVYYKMQKAYCFSGNRKTNGKSMDVIDFVMYQENLSKSEAINKCKKIIGYQKPASREPNFC